MKKSNPNLLTYLLITALLCAFAPWAHSANSPGPNSPVYDDFHVGLTLEIGKGDTGAQTIHADPPTLWLRGYDYFPATTADPNGSPGFTMQYLEDPNFTGYSAMLPGAFLYQNIAQPNGYFAWGFGDPISFGVSMQFNESGILTTYGSGGYIELDPDAGRIDIYRTLGGLLYRLAVSGGNLTLGGSPLLTQSSISSLTLGNLAVGTVTSGTWNGSIINAAYLGTGSSSTKFLRGDGTWQTANTLFTSVTGTTAADNASAGGIGEFVSSYVATGAAVNVPNATGTNVTSISLTAGDWDVEGNVNYKLASAVVNTAQAAINTTGGAIPTDGSEVYTGVLASGATFTDTMTVPRKRVNVTTTTTVYLVTKANVSMGTMSAFGGITARRVR